MTFQIFSDSRCWLSQKLSNLFKDLLVMFVMAGKKTVTRSLLADSKTRDRTQSNSGQWSNMGLCWGISAKRRDRIESWQECRESTCRSDRLYLRSGKSPILTIYQQRRRDPPPVFFNFSPSPFLCLLWDSQRLDAPSRLTLSSHIHRYTRIRTNTYVEERYSWYSIEYVYRLLQKSLQTVESGWAVRFPIEKSSAIFLYDARLPRYSLVSELTRRRSGGGWAITLRTPIGRWTKRSIFRERRFGEKNGKGNISSEIQDLLVPWVVG